MRVQDADLKSLRIFETIVRCGGFSAAQSALNISASVISEQMSLLESRLGLRLCERGLARRNLDEAGAVAHNHMPLGDGHAQAVIQRGRRCGIDARLRRAG